MGAQDGACVAGVLPADADGLGVLVCNSNRVGQWDSWDKCNELDREGITMYGQMTAGSWIYIGTQGILQGKYETFAAAGRKHFGGDLAGKLVVTGGMGG